MKKDNKTTTWETDSYGNYALYDDVADRLMAEVIPTSDRGHYNVFYRDTKHIIFTNVKGIATAKALTDEWFDKMFWNASSFVLLKAVARHSKNIVCQHRAMALLNPSDYDIDLKLQVMRGDGSFMSACYRGDIFEAYLKADGMNKKALEEEIDLIDLIF